MTYSIHLRDVGFRRVLYRSRLAGPEANKLNQAQGICEVTPRFPKFIKGEGGSVTLLVDIDLQIDTTICIIDALVFAVLDVRDALDLVEQGEPLGDEDKHRVLVESLRLVRVGVNKKLNQLLELTATYPSKHMEFWREDALPSN